MKTSISIGSAYSTGEDWQGLVDYTLEAERIGVSQAWSAEAWGMDSVVPLAYLAAKTERIMLGTRIMQISARVPSMIAMTAQSLATVSNNRFLLGLGVSGPQIVEGLHGAAFAKPLGRLRECVDIVRMGLRGESLKYEGEHYQLPRAGGEGKPIRLSQAPRPDLPIYLATLGPKSLEMTGEIANGWAGSMFMPEHAQVFLDPLRRGAEKSGRNLEDLDIQVDVNCELGDNVEDMIERLRTGLAFTLGAMGSAKTNFYNQAVGRSGYEDMVLEVQQLWAAGKKAAAIRLVPDEIILRMSLIGTEAMICERLRTYRDAGVNTLHLNVGGDGWLDSTERLSCCMDVINREIATWER